MISSAPPDLVHDWNQPCAVSPRKVGVVDETLRDGLQSPSAHDPSLDTKLELIHDMAKLGIEGVAIGFPSAGERQYEHALAMAREIASARLSVLPCCAARTAREDILAASDIAQRVGARLQIGVFLGSSPIRKYTEGWSLDQMLRLTEQAVALAVQQGLDVLFVTEDSTRSTPDMLKRLYEVAIRSGARQICVADTVGHATPSGAANIVRYVQSVVAACDPNVGIDWHGHDDRGLSLANALAAWEAGAARCHGTALGIGERSGNTPIELLLVNQVLCGFGDRDLSGLPRYVESAAAALGFDIPPNHPIVGADAFRTATGVHAAALLKAKQRSENWLADHVYSSVPAALVGRTQLIEVGPMSGEANVTAWLSERGLPLDPHLIALVLNAAKRSDRVLTAAELEELVEEHDRRRDMRAASSI